MVLPQSQTVLIVIIIWLPISPIKPRDRLILMRPPPLSLIVVRVVTSSSGSSKPEGSILPYISGVKQHRLQPVLNSRVIQLSHPTLMESTQNISIVLCDSFSVTYKEAPAAASVLLQEPPIRALVSILGQGSHHQQTH